MPPKDSATEMIYKILDNMSGVGVNYDAKTNTITYTEPKTTIYDKVTVADNCYVNCGTNHQCSQCENWKQKEEEVEMKHDAKPVHNPFAIRSVLSNRKKNAFSVVWMDGTTTVVHCQAGDEWDDEKALAMCFTKKALGNKGNFNDKFNDALDNKMKTIPADPAPEKACDCDGTCKECKCEKEKVSEMAKAVEKMKKSANIATSSFKDMIDELVGESKEKPEPAHTYKIYIRVGGKSHFDSNKYSIESLRERVHEIAEELYGKKPYYYRTWMSGDRMIIDFGHYTQFIEIEGITPSEFAKN